MRRWLNVCAIAALVAGGGAPSIVPLGASSDWTIVGSIDGPADLIQVHQPYVYVAAGPTLRIIDISDPSSPKTISSFNFPEKVWAFAVSGGFVYAADDWVGFAILDATKPEAPVLRGTFKTLGQAWGLAVADQTAVIANQMSGIDVLDISNLDKPVLLGQYFTEGYARDVAVSGTLAYVVDQPTGFSVLDVSEHGPPQEVSSQQTAQSPLIVTVVTPDAAASSSPKLVCIVGGRGRDGSRLQVYDVSDPSAPARRAVFKTPGRALRVIARGTNAYVADGPGGLQVVDLTDPANPVVADTYKAPGQVRDVAVSESLTFVVSGDIGQGGNPRTGGAGVLIVRRGR
jgi:hypothetical protein